MLKIFHSALRIIGLLLPLVAASAALMIFAGCRTEEKNSILILAFEHLNSQENLCDREKNALQKSGFTELCGESIRFTHAYVPSTLTVPNLSTLLTGLYPYQHHVRHNGPPGLSPEFVSAAEIALQSDYRTSFFSGGAPVFRKSGLNQGFEVFDEAIQLAPRNFFRPFNQSVTDFSNWLKGEAKEKPFFSVIYIPDLIFKDSPTINDLSEARSLGYESQLEEMDESLSRLMTLLKKNHVWDQTTVIVTGLNGRPNPERTEIIQPLNLHSENIQVSLLIKPPHPPRAVKASRTFDASISLADIGRTLFELMGQNLRKRPDIDSLFPVLSFKDNLDSTSAVWPPQRAIPIESSWLVGHQLGSTRAGVVLNHELLLLDKKPKIYNTLTDRLENHPNSLQNSSNKHMLKLMEDLVTIGYQAWSWPDSIPMEIFQIPQELWWRPENETRLLDRIELLTKAKIPVTPLDSWGSLIALHSKQTKKLNSHLKRMNFPSWSQNQNPCFQLKDREQSNFAERKKCTSKIFLQWWEWKNGDSKKTEADLIKSALFKSFAQQDLKRSIQKLNWGIGLLWDDYNLSHANINELDMVLSQSENSKDYLLFSKTLESQAQNKNDLDFAN